MKRRRMAMLSPIVLALSAISLRASPNVVTIISDDAGWADFGFMRNAIAAANPGAKGAIPTPNLDRLASLGVAFTQGYAASVCSPSRAMIATGMYGQRFGYLDNIADSSGPFDQTTTPQGLNPSLTTVWERMGALGYDTAVVGKWHLGKQTPGAAISGNRPQEQGVQLFQGLLDGSRGYFVGNQTGDGQLRQTISNGAGNVSSNTVIEGNYNGQYVTDVLGDLGSNYIRSKESGSTPFYLYQSFTAPHTPLQATAADLAYIDSLGIAGFTGDRRTQAAMQYAMDRNVGKILDAIEDPNGDGNKSDSKFNDTLIVFVNDNGGDSSDSDPNASSNGQLRNGKGSQFEGGLRVPFIVAGAGVAAGARGSISSALVHVTDIVPTVVGAAGGTFAANETIDGVSLVPLANGDLSKAHDYLIVNRYTGQQAGVRKGDYKYVYNAGTVQLYNLATNISESNNIAAQNPALVKEFQELLTSYDVQFDKPRSDLSANSTNQFDRFRFREEAAAAATFSGADVWQNTNAGSGTATMTYRDAYPNNQLVFRAKASGSYTVTNDLLRYDGLSYMANRIELNSATAALTTNQTATISGLPIFFAKSLTGAPATISLAANDAAAPGKFTFKVETPIELYDTLTLSGNGNQNFEVNGGIKGYRAGPGILKTGTAALTIRGGIDVGGTVDLQAGEVSIIDNALRGNVRVGSTASLLIGGRGFNRLVQGLPPGGAPPIVTAGLDLNFDARQNAVPSTQWISTVGSATLTFAAASSPVVQPATTYASIDRGYAGSSGGSASGLNNYFETAGPRSAQDATFETFFYYNGASSSVNQVVLEVGGVDRGVSFSTLGDQLKFNVDGDGTDNDLLVNLTPGWHHAVGVIDLNATGTTGDSIKLYLDNSLVGSMDNLLIHDWAGGNDTSIGAAGSSVTGVTGTDTKFRGLVSIARYYANKAFTAAEVNQNDLAAKFDPITPTFAPTQLAINGTFQQDAGGRIAFDFVGSQNDSLIVTGAAALAGGISLQSTAITTNLYTPISLIQAASVSGQFATVEGVAVSTSAYWALMYSASGVVVQLALPGDANLDHAVNFDDLLILAQNYNLTGRSWVTGDFTGDGVAGFEDLLALAQRYGTSASTLGANGDLDHFAADWALAQSLVPEPAAAMVIACMGMLAVRRR